MRSATIFVLVVCLAGLIVGTMAAEADTKNNNYNCHYVTTTSYGSSPYNACQDACRRNNYDWDSRERPEPIGNNRYRCCCVYRRQTNTKQ